MAKLHKQCLSARVKACLQREHSKAGGRRCQQLAVSTLIHMGVPHLQQLVPRAAAQQLVMRLQHLTHGDGVHLCVLSAGVSLGGKLLFTLLLDTGGCCCDNPGQGACVKVARYISSV